MPSGRFCDPRVVRAQVCSCAPRGHHRAACAQSGVLARRGFAVESVVARVCREGGAMVLTNIMVRDMDVALPNTGNSRRIEVLADGLALFGGVQLAIDTTLVSLLHADGSARPGAAQNDGVALRVAIRQKERRYPELSGHNNRCRMVVLAGEVGGRWSDASGPWRGSKHVQNHHCCANGWSKFGDSGVGPHSLGRLPGRLPAPWWTSVCWVGQTGTSL